MLKNKLDYKLVNFALIALIVFLLSINTVMAEINTPLPLPDAATTVADYTSENQFKLDKGDKIMLMSGYSPLCKELVVE